MKQFTRSLTLLLIIVGCGKKEEKTSESIESTDEQVEVVNLAAPKESEALSIAMNLVSGQLALPTLSTSLRTKQSRLLDPIVLNDGRQVLDSDNNGYYESPFDDAAATADADFSACSNKGEPMGSSTKKMYDQDPAYAKSLVRCLISAPSSAEAIVGNMSMVKGVLCALEKANGASLEFSETEKTYSFPNVTLGEDCFTKGFVENSKSDGLTSFSITAKTIFKPEANFPSQIEMNIADAMTLKLQLLLTEDTFSFAKIEENAVAVVTVDRSAGVIRAHMKDLRWGRTSSFLLSGDVTENGALKALDGINMLYSEISYPSAGGSDNTPSTRAEYSGRFISAAGDNANGVAYRQQVYRCSTLSANRAGKTAADCSGPTTGDFSELASSCDARGADTCLKAPHTFSSSDVEYFANYNQFTAYTNPSAADLSAFMENPAPLCFNSLTATMDPNASCRGTALSLAAPSYQKSVPFRVKERLPSSSSRISDWTENCGDLTGQINSKYVIGGDAKSWGVLIKAMDKGRDHKVAFGIISPFGDYYADYKIDVTVSKNGTVLGSTTLETPNPVVQPASVEIPIVLDGMTSSDELLVHMKGTFSCKTTLAGNKASAYSMSWGPGALRLLYTP